MCYSWFCANCSRHTKLHNVWLPPLRQLNGCHGQHPLQSLPGHCCVLGCVYVDGSLLQLVFLEITRMIYDESNKQVRDGAERTKRCFQTLKVTGLNGLAPTDSPRFSKQRTNHAILECSFLLLLTQLGKVHQFTIFTALRISEWKRTFAYLTTAMLLLYFSTIMYIWDIPTYLHFKLQEWWIHHNPFFHRFFRSLSATFPTILSRGWFLVDVVN